MGINAYGRSRSGLGKIHIIDPETYNGTITGGSAMCCYSSCVRMVKGETVESLRIVDCKKCLKMHAKRNAASQV